MKRRGGTAIPGCILPYNLVKVGLELKRNWGTISRIRFSRRKCTKREGNVMDRVATVQDGLPMMKIVVYGSANLEPHFSSGVLQRLI